MQLLAYDISDVGRARAHNEDAVLSLPASGLFAVCDGVGGSQAGEVASRMVVEALQAGWPALARQAQAAGEPGSKQVLDALMDGLEQLVIRASEEIFRRAAAEPALTGMATTAVALAVSGDRAAIAHVGDSRVYLRRGARLHQLTEDHSLALEMLRQGTLKESEIENFPYRNVIVRAVGQHPTVQVDTMAVDLLPGDTLLLASDGLSDQVDERTIREALRMGTPQLAAERLVNLANLAGGEDNTTVVVVEALADARMDDPEPTRRAELETLEKVEYLSRFFLFRDLSFPQILRLLKLIEERRPRRGQTILREGETGDALFLIVHGEVVITRKKVQLVTLGSGAHFGELALLTESARSATAVAHTDCRLLVITRADLLEVIREDPELASRLLWRFLTNLGGRLKEVSTRYAEAKRRLEQG